MRRRISRGRLTPQQACGARAEGLFAPNPKLKLREQVDEVMGLIHYSSRKGMVS